VKEVPVPKFVPPDVADHQVIVPAFDAVAPRVTVPVLHLEFGVVVKIAEAGLTEIACVRGVVFVPQPLPDVTLMFPPAAPAVAEMEIVPCPELIVQPAGTDHVYIVASVTAAILYVLIELAHTVVNPVIGPGAAGSAEVIDATTPAL
jgi:hypothetical protein